MPTSIGVFATRDQAEYAVHELLAADIPQEVISLLTPESESMMHRTSGKRVGAYIGGAIGTSTGLSLGLAAATLSVPGLGPVLAIGLGAAALLGLGGVTAGRSVGSGIDALNEEEHGLPDNGRSRRRHDVPDAAFFHDVLRQSRSIVVVQTDESTEHVRASAVLNRLSLGAQSDVAAPAGRVSSRNAGDVLVISLIGRIVAGDPTAAFHELVYQAVELGSRKILVDMAGVTFIDSSGIGELVHALLRLRNAGGQMKLTNLPEKVCELMSITHLDKVMDIQSDEAKALAAFAS